VSEEQVPPPVPLSAFGPPETTAHWSLKLPELQLMNLVPRWIPLVSFFLSVLSFYLSSPSAVFRSVWEGHGYHGSACKCSIYCRCYNWNKNRWLFIFLYSKIIATRLKSRTFPVVCEELPDETVAVTLDGKYVTICNSVYFV